MPLNKVRVLCPNGRRQVVQVDANTSILLIRETVCQKQNFEVQSHELKFHKRFLDDSSTLRFESIPNNGELELVKSTRQRPSGAQSKVVILLQTEEGQRNSKEFLQTATLWDVVTEFGHESCKEGTQQSCRYLMKTVIGKEDLQKITLRSLGIIDGRVCLRYMEVPLLRNEEQAHVVSLDLSKVKGNSKEEMQDLGSGNEVMYSITEWDNKNGVQSDEKKLGGTVGEDAVASAAAEVKVNEDVGQSATAAPEEVKIRESLEGTASRAPENERMQSLQVPLKEKELQSAQVPLKENQLQSPQVPLKESKLIREDIQMNDPPPELCSPVKEKDEDQEMATQVEDVNIDFLDDNGSVLLDPSLSSESYLKWDPPDDFFEFTLADAFLLQKRLREQVVSESTLMLRGKTKSTSSKTYSMCIVRIHLPPPDGLLLQSTFLPSDSIGDVLSFVGSHLKRSDLNHYLFTTPPKEILDPSSTLAANDLVPSCLVHLGIHPSNHDCSDGLVKDQIRAKAVSIDAYNRKMGCKEVEKETMEAGSCSKQLTDDEMDHSGAASACRPRSNVNRTTQKTQNGVPKWFKLGKN